VGRDDLVGTSWTVQGSNPAGDGIFGTRAYRPWGPPRLLYNEWVPALFLGGKAAGSWC
jgi:hypothetical protein